MADEAAAPIRELPPEIWKLILSNLEDSHLITCRFVNRRWRRLADEVLREASSLWKLTFGWEQGSDLFSGGLGTRFSKLDEITSFMEEMEGVPNPFPNGTVIFSPALNLMEDQHIAIHVNFSRLLEVFKECVLNLAYEIDGFPEEFDLNNLFRSILNLRNLKGLMIGSIQWENGSFAFLRCPRSQKIFKEMLVENQVTLPERLKELRIEGSKGVIPLSYMFGGSESVLKSVSSLQICCNLDERLGFSLSQFPSLKKLKVYDPNAEFLKKLQQFKPNCVASLKEVSFYFEDAEMSEMELNIKETFELLDFHADTLELLHLDFDFYMDEEDDVMATEMFTSVKYSKLKKLILKEVDKDEWRLVISELIKKLVNLEEFTIILHRSRDSFPVPRDEYKKVVAFWDLLPATVKVIHVPEYGWEVKRGESRRFCY